MFFFILIPLLISMNINCMQSSSANLDTLPADTIGIIVSHWAKSIGSSAVANKEDIPVIARNITSLSLVNKALYGKVNHVVSGSAIVNILAERFAMNPLTIATQLKSTGGHRWIENYLEGTQEYDQFKQLQQFYSFIDELREEFKPLDFNIDNGKNGWPTPNPFYSQTKQGFLLLLDSTPSELATPWGKIKLCSGGSGMGYLFNAFTQAFF